MLARLPEYILHGNYGVILQVGSFKLRKKRIFRMSPIHHHFELLGWHENQVIIRFWILSIMFALFGHELGHLPGLVDVFARYGWRSAINVFPMFVVAMGDEFKVLATNTMAGQSFIASPVIADGNIYLRSRTHLFRIGNQ